MAFKKLFVLLIFSSLSSANGQDIKLMTYNIKYDNVNDTINNWNDRKMAMIGLICHYGPQIIGMQEVLHNQVVYIDSSLTDYSYIGVGRDDGKQKGEYAPILYDSNRFKVQKSGTFWLSETPGKVSVGWDAALERICTYGLFEDHMDGKKLWVFNTHFDHVGQLAREKSAALIIRKIKEINPENLPVVLMGDLNLTPDQKPIRLINSYLEDGKQISKNPFYGPAGTFNGFDQNQILDDRIDYVFAKNVEVEHYLHIDDRMENNKHISDHLPVLISILKK